jgi:hypothetical protein
MVNQIENYGWSLKNEMIDTNLKVPEATLKGPNTVERQLREIKSREGGSRQHMQ